MGIVFTCLIVLYAFFRMFGMFFKKKDSNVLPSVTCDVSPSDSPQGGTPGDTDIYMAIIALALSRAIKSHDDESGVITIKPKCSNWNPHANCPE